jgi:hypothetical protein
MAFCATVVLTASKFDDHDLVGATLRDDCSLDLTAIDERRANLDASALADHEHLLECDGVADRGIEALDTHALTLTGAVLLTASTKNSIHGELLLDERTVGPVKGPEF